MTDARTIIIRPLITEKGSKIREEGNQYFFEVLSRANKIEIKQAVEEVFSVDVVSVRTMVFPGKPRRLGRFTGHTSQWKKAVVGLKEGQTIDVFDTV
ncbi:MAG: 50S ribosomal protein L23 [Candidatus Eisenbacteria bacterium]|uniref:Large ribosomal subunit protein uL23 n=1 Tax=Eiseniibacteriota bacterium TaxID=2212470 RepID=A0A948W6Z1_UNCEI|nr:50S ribosomal protein L23 [Candidatus Eisenbacteria bacterium]MBU2691121.1 50S ribosomal protein L23 [Candidatus Eisenbacteria bacterium]